MKMKKKEKKNKRRTSSSLRESERVFLCRKKHYIYPTTIVAILYLMYVFMSLFYTHIHPHSNFHSENFLFSSSSAFTFAISFIYVISSSINCRMFFFTSLLFLLLHTSLKNFTFSNFSLLSQMLLEMWKYFQCYQNKKEKISMLDYLTQQLVQTVCDRGK